MIIPPILKLPNEVLGLVAENLFNNAAYDTSPDGRLDSFGVQDRCNFRLVCRRFATLIDHRRLFSTIFTANTWANVVRWERLEAHHPALHAVKQFHFHLRKSVEISIDNQSTLEKWIGINEFDKFGGVKNAAGLVPGIAELLSQIYRFPSLSSLVLTFPAKKHWPLPFPDEDTDTSLVDDYEVLVSELLVERERNFLRAIDKAIPEVLKSLSRASQSSMITSLTLHNFVGIERAMESIDNVTEFQSFLLNLRRLSITTLNIRSNSKDSEEDWVTGDGPFPSGQWFKEGWIPNLKNLEMLHLDSDKQYYPRIYQIPSRSLKSISLSNACITEWQLAGILRLSDFLETLVLRDCEVHLYYSIWHPNYPNGNNNWKSVFDFLRRGMRVLKKVELWEIDYDIDEETEKAWEELQHALRIPSPREGWKWFKCMEELGLVQNGVVINW